MSKALRYTIVLLAFLSGSLCAAEGTSSDVTTWIDQTLAQRWQEEGINPAARADDGPWCRRVYLDVIGRTPAISELRHFTEDDSPDKDARLVGDLLTRGSFASHWANVTHKALVPEVESNTDLTFYSLQTRNWLYDLFRAGRGYDDLARELVAWQVVPLNNNEGTPGAVYAVKKSKPEELAASTSRFLLGIRLECAQCHDHPFTHWKRQEFWQLAAFYAGLERSQNVDNFLPPVRDDPNRRRIKIEGTEEVVEVAFLGNGQRPVDLSKEARQDLADWIVDKNNPYFARAVVNRAWAHFFGIGIVDPVDDMDSHNPPSHPEILTRLAQEFIDHDFDIRWLVRTITLTRAYRLSSQQPPGDPIPARSFARFAVRPLNAEQYLRSIREATGYSPPANFVGMKEMLPSAAETSISQALAQMNGPITTSVIGEEAGNNLAALIYYPHLTDNQRLDHLYLLTLARVPTEDERQTALQWIERRLAQRSLFDRLKALLPARSNLRGTTLVAGPSQRTAWKDLLWMLVNSSEFAFNH